MVFIGRCIPCQHGQHDGHYEVIEAVSDGVLGGAICGCKGDCADEYVPAESVVIDTQIDTNALDFLRRFTEDDARG